MRAGPGVPGASIASTLTTEAKAWSPLGTARTDMRSSASATLVLALMAAMLNPLPWRAPTAAGHGAGSVVVSGGTLIDGRGGEPIARATIVVLDGRVAEVTSEGSAALPAGIERIDASGKWIVPGLIDMHVHYHVGWMDALFLRHGVTTVRDVGSGLDSILALREESRVPGVARPRIFACGPLIDGRFPRHGSYISVSVQTVEEARAT